VVYFSIEILVYNSTVNYKYSHEGKMPVTFLQLSAHSFPHVYYLSWFIWSAIFEY